MPCAEFEDLLEGYGDLTAVDRHRADAHLAACRDCRAYFETLSDLDQELTGVYAGVQPAPEFAAAVMLRASATSQLLAPPRPPSAWPEVLDFCGWAAVSAIAAMLVITLAAQAGIPLGFILR
jgi:predicted anti-sigma-YlaC factor YlaD